MQKREFPILEHDEARAAVIEPSMEVAPLDIAKHCVICFFGDVVEAVVQAHRPRVVFQQRWECGFQRIYEIEHNGRKVAFLLPGPGAPFADAFLEEAIAAGCRKFIVCGGAGVIGESRPVGHLIVPISAIRDEGTSYHYLPPSREVEASPDAVAAIEATLKEKGLDYCLGKTWTTDAPFRETRDKVALRCSEGCVTVEMEAAALFAVAKFRNVPLGQILYAGDDLTGEVWDSRRWTSRDEIRKQLFWLAVEACLRI